MLFPPGLRPRFARLPERVAFFDSIEQCDGRWQAAVHPGSNDDWKVILFATEFAAKAV
jgi:hypothetical protein